LISGVPSARPASLTRTPAWTSPDHYRVLLQVVPQARKRSHSPASIEIDFQQILRDRSQTGLFDEDAVEVFSVSGVLRRVPHRVDRFFGVSRTTVSFVVPDDTCTDFAVYFDTRESGRGRPRRYPGLVGNGDRFCEGYQRRGIAPTHFDGFVDFDHDGDLDLFQGGVEPFVYCYENVGANRLVDRGRLTSGGALFQLPCSRANRSWVTVAFYDLDGDGDLDFCPSFGDGPDAGNIIFYRNTTRERGGQLTFARVGPLQTISGVPLAGGAQAGGWFPSITLVNDWDGDGRGPDALVGSRNRCWLYRGLGTNTQGAPRFAEAVAVQAGGRDVELVNPRFDVADIDGDNDLDLFAGTQPGPVQWFQNVGSRSTPVFAAGQVIAWDGQYLIGDAHSGVEVADFDGDGLLDLASGRFWERTDLKEPARHRVFGGFFQNIGTRASPRFEPRSSGGPFTEQFQVCDAVRQNSVRAVDWDNDGPLDLLAGDTDGFVWFFRNDGSSAFPVFAPGEKLRARGKLLSVATTGGHARLDVSDWNHDGLRDLIVADGSGIVSLFVNRGRETRARLAAGTKLQAGGKPLQAGARASVLVCDWDNDGRKDLLLADEKGYSVCRNTGGDASPALAAPRPILFGGRPVSYVRPNLGAFVDWDGDGKRDLIGCHFENSVRFYRNLGSGAPGAEPQFADPEGVVILQAESPQMISGADVVDWNGDGDLDLLTGQGHGGSGLRFYARAWLEDELHGRHPVVTLRGVETKRNGP
jgi:hypothetical protein